MDIMVQNVWNGISVYNEWNGMFGLKFVEWNKSRK